MIFWIAESEAGDGSGLVQFEAYRGEDYDADGIPKPKALKGGPCETALRAVQHLVELLIVNNERDSYGIANRKICQAKGGENGETCC